MKKMGKGVPLDIQYFHGETKDGLKKTIAKCVVKKVNIPNTLLRMGYFFRFGTCDSVVTLHAETVCKPDDTYSKETGELVARKKIIRQFINFIESVLIDRAHDIEDERNDICDYIDFIESTKDSITEYLKKF